MEFIFEQEQTKTQAEAQVQTTLCPTHFVLGIIDPQNDFCEGGSLAVSKANEIFGPINKLRYMLDSLHLLGIPTFISMDTHPEKHISFASTHGADLFEVRDLKSTMANGDIVCSKQCMWPTHCVDGTEGFRLHPDLITNKSDLIINKGKLECVESYSAFGDESDSNQYENTLLNTWLSNQNVTDIILTGLATDYCVYYTGLDAIKYGYRVHIILSCVRGVSADTTNSAIDDLTSKGAHFYQNLSEFFSRNAKTEKYKCFF